MSFNRFTMFVRHFNDGLFLDQRVLDAMEPEFKEAYKELAKAIRENDKSDAVKYTYFKAVVDAMKQNDKEKVSNGLKAIQSQFASAEKKLADTLSEATQKQAQAKQATDQAKAQLKAKQKLVAQFANVYKALDAIANSPKSASKLQAVIGKLGEFGTKLSSKSQSLAFKASAGKDVAKEIASFRKAVDAEKKSADKAIATLTKESQKLDNAEKEQAEKVKLTKDKQLAFQKEKLDIANAGKALGAGKSSTKRDPNEWNTIKGWFCAKNDIPFYAFNSAQILEEREKALKVRLEVVWKPGVHVMKDLWIPKSVVTRNVPRPSGYGAVSGEHNLFMEFHKKINNGEIDKFEASKKFARVTNNN